MVLSQCKSTYALVADDSREATLHASLVLEVEASLCLLNKRITVTDRSCVVIPLARLSDCETVSTNHITVLSVFVPPTSCPFFFAHTFKSKN